jgi:hypothetical protein
MASKQTYGELLVELQKLNPEQLNQTVTVYVQGLDEYYATEDGLLITDSNDVLDAGHAYLKL